MRLSKNGNNTSRDTSRDKHPATASSFVNKQVVSVLLITIQPFPINLNTSSSSILFLSSNVIIMNLLSALKTLNLWVKLRDKSDKPQIKVNVRTIIERSPEKSSAPGNYCSTTRV